jgi:hypothetical protein
MVHGSAYHPQMNGQIERVNKILENKLRACMMENQGSWDKNLPWDEFSYNSSYQESLIWHHSRHCMDVDAAFHSTRLSQERRLSLVLISSMR